MDLAITGEAPALVKIIMILNPVKQYRDLRDHEVSADLRDRRVSKALRATLVLRDPEENGAVRDRKARKDRSDLPDPPDITVVEDTPASYKLSFKSGEQQINSPNLKYDMPYYNLNLAAAGSTYDIPLGKLILTASFASTVAIRLVLRAADVSVPILADIRRTSIYDGASIESQTYNNTKITTTITLDDIVYSMSQEMHWMRIRQQDPDTNLWSMCEVRTFASANNARTSICVDWFYTGADFQTP